MNTESAAPAAPPPVPSLSERFPALTIDTRCDGTWRVYIGYAGREVRMSNGPVIANLLPDEARKLAQALSTAVEAIEAERARLDFTS